MLVTEHSMQLLAVGLSIMLFGVIMATPWVQSFWGVYVFSFKNVQHTVNALLMIKQAKGDFENCLDYNKNAFIFFFICYYTFVIYLMNAFFFKV